MKQITPALLTHLQGEVTSLCTCWLIKRQDGMMFGFTDHDQDLIIDGMTYEASTGFMRSAISNSGAFGVDELEAEGFLDSESLTEQDLRAGMFNYAEVWLFMVNWQDLSQGLLRLRYGHFGEVTFTSTGLFNIELRGLIQQLSQTIGNVYMPECRTDLGDDRCKVILNPPKRIANHEYAVNDRVKVSNDPVDKAFQAPVPTTQTNDGWAGWVDDYAQRNQLFGPDGERFLAHSFGHLLGGSSINFNSVDFPITGGTITGSDIDSGNMEIHLEWLQANYDQPGDAGIGVGFKRADGTTMVPAAPVRESTVPINLWRKRERTVPIPIGARTAYILGSLGSPSGMLTNTWSASCVARVAAVVRPVMAEATDYTVYGGVEYRAIGGGTTADSAATNFPRTIGTTFTDGSVTWEVIKPVHRLVTQIATVTSRSIFTVTGAEDKVDNWFRWGVIEILTGPARGFRIECRLWTQATGKVELALPLPFMPQPGDYVLMQTGCNKSRDECRLKFQNILNFRGEPDIPGTDQYFRVGKPV